MATGFRVRGFVIRGFCRFRVSSTAFQVRGFAILRFGYGLGVSRFWVSVFGISGGSDFEVRGLVGRGFGYMFSQFEVFNVCGFAYVVLGTECHSSGVSRFGIFEFRGFWLGVLVVRGFGYGVLPTGFSGYGVLPTGFWRFFVPRTGFSRFGVLEFRLLVFLLSIRGFRGSGFGVGYFVVRRLPNSWICVRDFGYRVSWFWVFGTGFARFGVFGTGFARFGVFGTGFVRFGVSCTGFLRFGVSCTGFLRFGVFLLSIHGFRGSGFRVGVSRFVVLEVRRFGRVFSIFGVSST